MDHDILATIKHFAPDCTEDGLDNKNGVGIVVYSNEGISNWRSLETEASPYSYPEEAFSFACLFECCISANILSEEGDKTNTVYVMILISGMVNTPDGESCYHDYAIEHLQTYLEEKKVTKEKIKSWRYAGIVEFYISD